MSNDKVREEGFSTTFYVQSIRAMLLAPGAFLESLPDSPGMKRSFAFLLVSSVLHALMSIPFLPVRPLLMTAVLFINALIMPVLSAVIGYGIVLALLRKPIAFSKFLSVYAFSSGTTHLVSWIPLAVWITEPWRWILIGIGMVRGCGLSRLQAAAVVIVSILSIMLLFSVLSTLLVRFRG